MENADLAKQNALLEFLRIKEYNVKYFYAGREMDFPSTITSEDFLSSESKEVVINLQTCKLYYYLNAFNEMEFYTDSVIHLDYREAKPIFEFIHHLGRSIQPKFICITVMNLIQAFSAPL